ncbi:MAG: O-antigen ligase family protein [Candidatus Paceibacterota bacterium]|jgi:uncharacterized membrane protein
MDTELSKKESRFSIFLAQARSYIQSEGFSPLKIFIWIATILLLFAPLVVDSKILFPFVSGKSFYFIFFAEIIFFSWLGLIIFKKQYRPKINTVSVILAVFLIAASLSTVFGVDPSRSFWSNYERMTGLSMLLHLFAFFLVISSTFKKNDWLWIFGFSNVAAVIASFSSLFSINAATRGGGTLGNDSFLGSYLVINVFLAVYLFFGFKDGGCSKWIGKAVRSFAVLSFSVMTFCLLFEGSIFWQGFIKSHIEATSTQISLEQMEKEMVEKEKGLEPFSSLVGLFEGTFFWKSQIRYTQIDSEQITKEEKHLEPLYLLAKDFFPSMAKAANSPLEPSGSPEPAVQAPSPGLAKDLLNGGARAAKYSMLGGLLLLIPLFLFLKKEGKTRIAGAIFLGAVSLSALVLFYLALQPGSWIYEKFVQMATMSRIEVWKIAWQSFLQRPFLGWGPDNFEIAFSSNFSPKLFLPEYGGEIWFDRAHNIIMDNLVSFGILGSILYLGIFAGTFWSLVRLRFSKKIGLAAAAVPLAALAAYFVQNLTVFDMVSSLVMFFLILGFAASLDAKDKEEARPDKMSFSYLRCGLMSGAVLAIFIFSFLTFIAGPYKTGILVIKAGDSDNLDMRLEMSQAALGASSEGKYQVTTFLADSLINSRNAPVSKKRLLEELNFLSGELKKNIAQSPLDFRLYLKLGEFYNAWGGAIDSSKLAAAQEVLEEAINLSPNNQQAYWGLIKTKLTQARNMTKAGDKSGAKSKYDEAMALADAAIKIEPKVEQAHLMAMQIAKNAEDRNLYEEKKKEALEINPGWEEDIKNKFEDNIE